MYVSLAAILMDYRSLNCIVSQLSGRWSLHRVDPGGGGGGGFGVDEAGGCSIGSREPGGHRHAETTADRRGPDWRKQQHGEQQIQHTVNNNNRKQHWRISTTDSSTDSTKDSFISKIHPSTKDHKHSTYRIEETTFWTVQTFALDCNYLTNYENNKTVSWSAFIVSSIPRLGTRKFYEKIAILKKPDYRVINFNCLWRFLQNHTFLRLVIVFYQNWIYKYIVLITKPGGCQEKYGFVSSYF